MQGDSSAPQLCLLDLPPQCLSLIAAQLPFRRRLQLAAVCRALRDHLAASPQLWEAVEFDQYEQQEQRRRRPAHAAAAAADGDAAAAALADWRPWLRRLDTPPGPHASQLVHFERFLAHRAHAVRRLRLVPASDWSHMSVAPRVVELCAALGACTGLVSLELSTRCLLHLGIWLAPLRRLRHLGASAASLALSRHVALPCLTSLLLQCAPQQAWDHDLHYGRLEVEEGAACFPPGLRLLSLRHLEAPALPPGLAVCGRLRELQLDHVLLDGEEAEERLAPLSALTALTALRLDAVPCVALPASLASMPALQRLSVQPRPDWHPESVHPPRTSLEASCSHLLACTALTSLWLSGFDEAPCTLWELAQLRELRLGAPPAQGGLQHLSALERLSLQYDNARAPGLLSEEAVQALGARLTALHLGGTPTQPAVSLPLLVQVLRRLQLGAPRLRDLTASCVGVQAALRHVLSLEAEGGVGFEFEPASEWMRQRLAEAGGSGALRRREAAWVRHVWRDDAAAEPPTWLQPWGLPSWDAA